MADEHADPVDQLLLQGLETGFCEYDGTYVKQPRAAIRACQSCTPIRKVSPSATVSGLPTNGGGP